MPNKTIYVKDSDLPLWEAAQAKLGESMSTLFAEFLRQRIEAPVNGFVHVLRSDPDRRRDAFAVMFAPMGPTGAAGWVKSHYVSTQTELRQFLTSLGFLAKAVAEVESELKNQGSASVSVSLPRKAIELF
jgi:hypothetical protein